MGRVSTHMLPSAHCAHCVLTCAGTCVCDSAIVSNQTHALKMTMTIQTMSEKRPPVAPLLSRSRDQGELGGGLRTFCVLLKVNAFITQTGEWKCRSAGTENQPNISTSLTVTHCCWIRTQTFQVYLFKYEMKNKISHRTFKCKHESFFCCVKKKTQTEVCGIRMNLGGN